MKKIISQMTQNLLMALSTRSQYQEIREKFRQPVTDKGTILKTKPQSTQKDILSVCCDPLILAQQLTYIELVRHSFCVNYFVFHLLNIIILINMHFSKASLRASSVLIKKYQVLINNKTHYVHD